jgi:hypothetical protein
MNQEIVAITSEDFKSALQKAAQVKSATFIFVNDTDYQVYDLNHGWEYRTGGGLITVGARVYARETYSKTTQYESGCMVRCIGNFKINGKLYETVRSRDAETGKCYGTYRHRIYVQQLESGESVIESSFEWEDSYPESA